MATNRIEHFLADIGAVHAAATPMSIYNTLSPEQVAFVAGHAQPTVVVPRERRPPGPLGRRRSTSVDGSLRKVVVLDARTCPTATSTSLGRPAGRRRGVPRGDHADEVEARAAGSDPGRRRRRSSTPPGTTGQPQGRRAHPPQRALRGRQHARGRRARGPAARGQLPAARAHRRARARPLRPADPRAATCTPSATRPQLLGALGEVHPTAFFGVPAGVGEDQDRPLRQARRRPRPRQPQAGRGLDGRRARLGAGAGGRRRR